MEPADPAHLAVHVEVGRLQTAYGDRVTRRDWPGVAALFAPDATVTLDLGRGAPRVLGGGAELVAFVEEALARYPFFLFSVLNRTVEVAPGGGRATGTVYLAELRQDTAGRSSVAYGRYEDAYTRTAAGWRIAARRYRSLARTAAPGSPADLELAGSETGAAPGRTGSAHGA